MQRAAEQHEAQLQRQGRTAQYRYQQEYMGRLRQQALNLRNDRHDYNNDPYFYTAAESSLQPWRAGITRRISTAPICCVRP